MAVYCVRRVTAPNCKRPYGGLMAHPIKPHFTTHVSVRHSNKNGLFLTINLLILLISTITAYAQSNISKILLWAQKSADTHGVVTRQEPSVSELEPGNPVERELAGGEAHSYRLTLVAGQYARVVVDQRGINVAVNVFGSAGEKVVESEVAEIGEAEEVSLVADAAASYRLE